MTVLLVLGSCGSALVFVLALAGIGRSIFRQVAATEANTEAVEALTKKMDNMGERVSNSEIRIAVLEDRKVRP